MSVVPSPKPFKTAEPTAAGPTVVSACLVGIRCRYDGQTKPHSLPGSGPWLPVCPEVMAAMGVPRPAIHRSANGTVRVVATREDVTAPLSAACDQILKIATAVGARRAVLKQGSPSCGTQWTTMDGERVRGLGLLAERLAAAGFALSSEDDE